MGKSIEQFRANNTAVVVISQSTPEALAAQRKRNFPFPVVGDPDRAAYRAFGLERTSWLTFLRPDVIVRYLGQVVRLVPVKVPHRGEDVLQLGGDFLLDRQGRIVFAYRSRVPTDRPSVSRLLAAIPAPLADRLG